LGLNENRVPQLRQNPSVSPGRPSLDRPTGWSQWLQYRLFSGTCGSASTALAGSRYGTGGISSSPAPSLPRADLPLRPLALEREPRLPEAEESWPEDKGPEDTGPEAAGPEEAGPEEAGATGAAGAAASPQVVQ
jgi:hypothetical protein